jgi:hypothetical protein
MNRRDCMRCGKRGPVKRGVHFIVSDATTGECLSSYDVCADCMAAHSPLIIPAEAQRPGVTQVRLSYSSFGHD